MYKAYVRKLGKLLLVHNLHFTPVPYFLRLFWSVTVADGGSLSRNKKRSPSYFVVVGFDSPSHFPSPLPPFSFTEIICIECVGWRELEGGGEKGEREMDYINVVS